MEVLIPNPNRNYIQLSQIEDESADGILLVYEDKKLIGQIVYNGSSDEWQFQEGLDIVSDAISFSSLEDLVLELNDEYDNLSLDLLEINK
jgi:hypothetical protein